MNNNELLYLKNSNSGPLNLQILSQINMNMNNNV